MALFVTFILLGFTVFLIHWPARAPASMLTAVALALIYQAIFFVCQKVQTTVIV